MISFLWTFGQLVLMTVGKLYLKYSGLFINGKGVEPLFRIDVSVWRKSILYYTNNCRLHCYFFCRYGVFDFEYSHQCQGTTDTSLKQKLIMITWCPETAKVKKKMLYSSSHDALKRALVGVKKYIQVVYYWSVNLGLNVKCM